MDGLQGDMCRGTPGCLRRILPVTMRFQTLLADLHQCTDGPFTTVFREIPARTRAREGRSWGFSQRPAREHRKTRSTFYGTGAYVKTVVVIREKSRNC